MSNETTIDPELLKGLGKLHSTVPPERNPYDPHSQGTTGIIKSNGPPKHFDFGMPLQPPKK
jgi:hypothetical protein